ncbi:MAG: 50S ribosomal protein L25 [Actinobacteria bacterium]|nr:50S ribosomal protein L25 [Actinomycetota bacterium]
MSETSLKLETRKVTGKEISRRLRREGKLPGIFYFHGAENIPFSVNKKELSTLLSSESGLLNVIFDGKDQKKCVVREIQFDPLTNAPIHIDLLGITLTEKINVMVPIQLIGVPNGVKNEGGILQHHAREIEVECLPTNIPEHIEIDVTELNIGDSIHASSISVDKVKILADDDMVIANVGAPRIVEEEVPVTIGEEEEEGAEPEVVGKSEEDSE